MSKQVGKDYERTVDAIRIIWTYSICPHKRRNLCPGCDSGLNCSSGWNLDYLPIVARGLIDSGLVGDSRGFRFGEFEILARQLVKGELHMSEEESDKLEQVRAFTLTTMAQK